jgi:FkbM family methyltransferase
MSPQESFVILDGGARDAYADPRWSVFDPKRLRLYGFDPDAAEVVRLNRESKERGLQFQFFAGVLWGSSTTVTFYENKSPGGGSCFAQNTDLTHRWKFENQTDLFLSRDIFYPVGETQWQTMSLDEWSRTTGLRDIDFIKLNVQGAELEIVKGAASLLDSVIGIMAEVSFVESYRNRPFFSDIDVFLRANNFAFFDLIGMHYMGRAASSVTTRHLPGLYPLWGQVIEAHGIYFKDPIDMEARNASIDHLDRDKLLKLVCFAEIFGQIEYAFELLVWLEGRLRRRNDGGGAELVAGLRAEADRRYKMYMV